jgi:dephospho-CoA kinase
MADHVIDNSGTLQETRAQVTRLVVQLTDGQLSGEAAP